ncbi:MAG TPA: hypothetical protein VGE97_05405 [Nitrososphaera sp.]|jgi:hypothetical protein
MKLKIPGEEEVTMNRLVIFIQVVAFVPFLLAGVFLLLSLYVPAIGLPVQFWAGVFDVTAAFFALVWAITMIVAFKR